MNKSLILRRVCLFCLIALAHLGECNAIGQANRSVEIPAGETSTTTPQLVVQLGHSSEINAAAYSADGRFIVSGGDDPVAILWEAATGRVIRRFVGHTRAVSAVAISSDGRFILTGSGTSDDSGETEVKPDNTARLWDAATGKEVRRFAGHTARIGAVDFSPDGQFVLTASDDGTARLWNAATGRIVRRLVEGRASFVKVARFSPDGHFIVTGGGDAEHEDYTIRLWDTATGTVVRRFVGSTEPIGALAISTDTQFILSGGEKPVTEGSYGSLGDVRLWNLKTGSEVRRFEAIGPVAFSPDGKLILTGSENGAALWDANTGKMIRLLGAVERPARATAEPVAKTDSKQTNPSVSLELEMIGVIETVAFSPDGRSALVLSNPILTGGSGGFTDGNTALRVCDVTTGKEVRRLESDSDAVSQVAFSADNRVIMAGNALWSPSTGQAFRFKEPSGEDIQKIFITALSADGRLALTSNSNDRPLWNGGFGDEDEDDANAQPTEIRLWDLTREKELARFPEAAAGWLSADDRFVLTMEDIAASDSEAQQDSETEVATDQLRARVWETRSGKELWHFDLVPREFSKAYSYYGLTPSNTDWKFSPDGRYVMLRGAKGTVLLNATDGAIVKRFEVGEKLSGIPLLAISPDARFFATGTRWSDAASGVHLSSTKTGSDVWNIRDPARASTTLSLSFSPNGRFLLATGGVMRLLDLTAKREVKRFQGQSDSIHAFSADSRFLLTVDAPANLANLWRIPTGERVQQFVGHLGSVTSVAFSFDGRFVITGSSDSTTRVWAASSGRELCRLVSFKDGTWAVTAPDGRFDTNNLEEIRGLQWIMPDTPFTPLPLEIFMRQYYEPRLLPRILAGEKFSPLQSLAKLNRVQPKVEIKEISKPDEQGRVAVAVDVSKARSETQRDSKGELLETGVYDLRLFRDGQLVGYDPKEGREVHLDADGTRTVRFENVRLPRKPGIKSVEFSAYAFNIAQVKSPTARKRVEIPNNLQPLKGRAYVVTVGVNSYENDAFDLNFAANDANRLQEVMHKSLAKSGEFEAKDIVQVSLISDYKLDSGKKVVTSNTATKRIFKAVLDLLSGKNVDDPELREQIPNVEQIRAARPEDLVLISFSSHGYAAPDGEFYFITSDTGPGTDKRPTPELLKRAISSEELSLWLRDVDAGETVMIVDACQSTAAVAAAGFKPGPMDSRGLGQLSYDKGMKILTATQSDSVALESKLIKQGLLTYALVHDGIEAEQADFKPLDKAITLSEWLAYGVNRVPLLYDEVKHNRVQNFGRTTSLADANTVIIRSGEGNKSDARILEEVTVQSLKIQQPSLFDFTKKQRDTVLVRK